jgi:hypothetical protein
MGRNIMKIKKCINQKYINVNYRTLVITTALILTALSPLFMITSIADPPSFTDIDVYVEPSTQTVNFGESFTIDVNCSPNGVPIRSFQFSLAFNPTLLQANSVTNVGEILAGPWTVFPSSGTIDNIAGTITLVYATILGTGNVTAPGRFATINFTAQSSAGTSNLDLYDVIVTDETSIPLPTNTTNGTATVEEELAREFGDAPECHVAYPSTMTIGGFPTCKTCGTLSWVEHNNFGA